MKQLSKLDKRVINQLQEGFPIVDSPYQHVAEQLNISEELLLERLQQLLDDGILSRFGPLYHAEQMGGALTLAAIKVPEPEFEKVNEMINAFPQVAHNYQRNHALNMWFVLATETSEQISDVIQKIEQKTGLTVFNMPKSNEYFVGLKLEA